MAEGTKIEFRHRRIQGVEDVTDLVEILFPGNRNQQHAAARILIELRGRDDLLPDMAFLEAKFDISRRTLQRARAKLNRLGLIERIGFLNLRHHGQTGWRLSKRFSSSMRRLAGKWESWSDSYDLRREQKDVVLAGLLK